MGCHFLLQGIFPTQGLNPSPAWQADSSPMSHLGSLQCIVSSHQNHHPKVALGHWLRKTETEWAVISQAFPAVHRGGAGCSKDLGAKTYLQKPLEWPGPGVSQQNSKPWAALSWTLTGSGRFFPAPRVLAICVPVLHALPTHTWDLGTVNLDIQHLF